MRQTIATGLTVDIEGVTINDTGNHAPNSAGISVADFSAGPNVVQTVTVNNSTLFNNLNRGLDARGYVDADINQSTLTSNGSDAHATGRELWFFNNCSTGSRCRSLQ